MEFNQKDYEYFDYIVEHKRNLMTAFNMLIMAEDFINSCEGGSIHSLNQDEVKELKNRVLIHDNSRFSKEEFYGYRVYFFTTKEEEHEANHMGISGKLFNESKFKRAWEHHYENNSHHPECHKFKMSKLDMIEMCLDWIAMSIKFKNSPLKYFHEKRDKLFADFGDRIDYNYVESILANINFYN